MADRAGLARTHSVPLRRRSSMKGCSQSPTRRELHAFETLLDGTGAQMPNRMQLLATHSISRYLSSLPAASIQHMPRYCSSAKNKLPRGICLSDQTKVAAPVVSAEDG